MEKKDHSDQLITVLLQEHDQYRHEVWMFDTHLFRVLVLYVTGLTAGLIWLGTRVVDAAARLVAAAPGSSALTLSKATDLVLDQLPEGPLFYLFVGVPVLTLQIFLFAARHWASLQERFDHLENLSDRIAGLVAGPALRNDAILRLDRGFEVPGRWWRQSVERGFFIFWLLVLDTIMVGIVFEVRFFCTSSPRLLSWLFGILCFIVSVVLQVVFGWQFLFRRRRRPRLLVPSPTQTVPPT